MRATVRCCVWCRIRSVLASHRAQRCAVPPDHERVRQRQAAVRRAPTTGGRLRSARRIGAAADPDAVADALRPLVQWGNLRGDPDTSRVTTIEDFHRPRFLYQLTREGEAVERALAAYDEHLGRRGSLQAVALADIAAQLRALEELARQANPDSARVSLLLRDLVGRFTDLADNAQAFMGSLQRTIDLYDADIETFRAYKDQLVEYLERFIKDLVTVGAEIAGLLDALERTGIARLLAIAAARDAEDAAPGRWRPTIPTIRAPPRTRRPGWMEQPLAGTATVVRRRRRTSEPGQAPAYASAVGDPAAAGGRRLAQRAALRPLGPVGGLPHPRAVVRAGARRRVHASTMARRVRRRQRAPSGDRRRHARSPRGAPGRRFDTLGRRPAAEDQPTASSDRQLRASWAAQSHRRSRRAPRSPSTARRQRGCRDGACSSAVGYEGCCPAQPARKARGRFVRAVLDAARGRAGNAPTRTTRGDDDHQRRHAACSPHLSGRRCPRRDPYAVGVSCTGPTTSSRSQIWPCRLDSLRTRQRPHDGTPSRNGHRLPLRVRSTR